MLPSLSLMRTLMYAAAAASAAADAAASADAAAADDDACRYKATATRQIIIEVQPPQLSSPHFAAFPGESIYSFYLKILFSFQFSTCLSPFLKCRCRTTAYACC
jgi:hypothetical protein